MWSSARLFYAGASSAMVASWALMSIGSGSDAHRRGLRYRITTSPSWLPRMLLLFLHRSNIYVALCYVAPLGLAAAAVVPSWRGVRIAAAALLALYHLAESSVTSSHRDYVNVYVATAFAVCSEERVAAGVALGVCVLLIAGSGWSKIAVGGAREWMESTTLGTMLSLYGSLSLADCGPLSQPLNRYLVRRPRLVRALAIATLVFECIVTPAALLLPPPARALILGVGSVGMHLGIAAVQSFIIGVAFLASLGAYAIAFGWNGVAVGGVGWGAALCPPLAAVLAAALLTYCSRRKGAKWRLLPEDWPCTPFALFAWNGSQWNTLFERFVHSDTRIVLWASSKNSQQLVGKPLVPKMEANERRGGGGGGGGGGEGAIFRIHDGWEQLLGETFAHYAVREALDFDDIDDIKLDDGEVEWDAQSFVDTVTVWLRKSRRLIELDSGMPLLNVAFVRIAARSMEGSSSSGARACARIAEVLAISREL